MSPVVRRARAALFAVAVSFAALPALQAQQLPDSARLERLKAEALTKVDGKAKMVQEIVDMLFSFSELGMQEFETQRYLTGILEREGFKVERGYADAERLDRALGQPGGRQAGRHARLRRGRHPAGEQQARLRLP